MAYCWYRCSKGLDIPDTETKIKACLFLCGSQQKIIGNFLSGEWDFEAGSETKSRLKILEEKQIFFDVNKLFPYTVVLSEGILKKDWLVSMMQKPRLFIRIRKQKDQIINLLQQNDIAFEEENEYCLSLAVGAAIDDLLPADAYVVQDASSQETGQYFKPGKNEIWYDCCSGAGGKSLLLKDIEPSIQLTVSDSRESILQNLKNRFKQYNHSWSAIYNLDVTDKENLHQKLNAKKFDGIICDVPCSGSGTWARTPEQLYFFKEDTIAEYSALQKSISTNVAEYLKPGAKLIYITCSVFKEENEQVVDHLISNARMELEKMEMINGIEKKADSMFIAVLRSKL